MNNKFTKTAQSAINHAFAAAEALGESYVASEPSAARPSAGEGGHCLSAALQTRHHRRIDLRADSAVVSAYGHAYQRRIRFDAAYKKNH